MTPGDTIELEIVDVAFGGDGVGRHEGAVVFVPFTIEGERVVARVTEVKRNYLRAGLVELISSSPRRVTPGCPLFGRCGGCRYQHVAYAHQVAIKRRQLATALARLGKLDPACVPADTLSAPQPYGYRNKITLHAHNGRQGYVGLDQAMHVPVESCPLASAAINARLLDLGSDGMPRAGELVLRSSTRGRTWTYVPGQGQTQGTDETVEEDVLGRVLRVPLRSFFQVNVPVAEQVAAHLAAVMGGLACGVLVDAYGGAGFFALLLAGQFEKVTGIEPDGDAVRAAQLNAEQLGLGHASFQRSTAERALGAVLAAAAPERTCVLLDPPRAGCSREVLATLAEQRPRAVLYVSCNPPILARDLARLTAMGYGVRQVVPFDMFPQAAPFEAVAVAVRE